MLDQIEDFSRLWNTEPVLQHGKLPRNWRLCSAGINLSWALDGHRVVPAGHGAFIVIDALAFYVGLVWPSVCAYCGGDHKLVLWTFFLWLIGSSPCEGVNLSSIETRTTLRFYLVILGISFNFYRTHGSMPTKFSELLEMIKFVLFFVLITNTHSRYIRCFFLPKFDKYWVRKEHQTHIVLILGHRCTKWITLVRKLT